MNMSPVNFNFHQFKKVKEDYQQRYMENQSDSK